MKNHASAETTSQIALIGPDTGAIAPGLRLDGLLTPAVYEDLRVLARRWLSQERSGHVLQTTALAHEAFLRLLGDRGAAGSGDTQYLALASLAMRRILVDEARAARREKRGGDWTRVPMPAIADAAGGRSVDLADLDEAMARLEAHDARKCRVVEMRFFGGLSNARIAAALEVTERTVERDWQYARVWLFRDLNEGGRAARDADGAPHSEHSADQDGERPT